MPRPSVHPPVTKTLDALTREQAAFVALATSGDPDLPVPSCPAWTVDDLVRHLAQVHRWAAASTWTPPDGALPDAELFAVPAGTEDYAGAAAALRAALADPQRPCRTLVGPGVVAWWARRQLHETFVHRLDLAEALGDPVEGDPWIAADCIAEGIDTMQPRQVRLGRMTAPETGISLRTPSGSWTLGARPVATVSGPDLALAQLLWRRTGLDDPRLSVTGDVAEATALLTQRLTP